MFILLYLVSKAFVRSDFCHFILAKSKYSKQISLRVSEPRFSRTNMSDNENRRDEEELVVIDDEAVNQDNSETPSLSDVDVDSLG